MFLTITPGPVLRDHVFSTVSAGFAYSTMNSLALTGDLHKYFDTGMLHLAPVLGADTEFFNPATCRSYDVELHWWHTAEELSSWYTQLPADPEEQVVGPPALQAYVREAPRPIEDRDVFRLYTNDPEVLPLTHPLLVELHGMLWRMITEAGMTQSGEWKKRTYAQATVDGDDDEDSDEDGRARGKARQGMRVARTKRPRPKGRRTSDDVESRSTTGANTPQTHDTPGWNRSYQQWRT